MGLDRNIGHGVLAIAVFSTITLLVDILALKSKKFRDLVEGTGTILIKDGKVMEDNLKKEKYSISELESLLRQKNVFNIADVEFAMLEPKGDLSVLLKKENRPLTPKDLNYRLQMTKYRKRLSWMGRLLMTRCLLQEKDRNWLHTELDKLGVTIENVFMGQVDSYGELTVDLYDDQIKVPSPQVRPLLWP